MLDPLSAVGAAAAATQFVELGSNITKFLYTTIAAIKDAPETLALRLEQVQQLISISRLIIEHPSFQTDSIEAVLGTCLRDIRKLQAVLLKLSPPSDAGRLRRWRVAFLAVMEEDSVQRAFSSLDQGKTTLVVCMEAINS